MKLHCLWLIFFIMVENMIDQASSCVPIVVYLDKMPNVWQTFPYVFLHISKPK
jgi:hypothetical protein